MGEWSKSIGEKGEDITKFLFEEILNFNSLIENSNLKCLKGFKHKISKSNKITHGIDGLISYVSPLEDYNLEIGLISVKYVGGEYPKYPSTLFKAHLKDLSDTIECFNKSKLKNDVNQKYTDVNKTEICGILVWLSNESDLNYELINKVSSIQIDKELIFDKIILVDNNKLNFLYDSIFRAKELYGNDNVDFVYHNTGLNLTFLPSKSYGKTFPINYLYSDLIALRITVLNEVYLSIYLNDDFNIDSLAQILSFAKSFDHLNSVNKTIINFRTYDYLVNENETKESLINFSTFKLYSNLEIKQFPSDFRNK